MRMDHWIKQLFIMPGIICAYLLSDSNLSFFRFVFGFLSTCLIASANYVINEYLDAEFDKFHPTKKLRSVVQEDVKGCVVWLLWIGLTVCGIALSAFVNIQFSVTLLSLWVMGILYNVKPIRTKDIVLLDVLSESINNAIRLLLGWFIVSSQTLPPSSAIFGYWMGGAFLMATKRFAEYRMIGNPGLAGQYRKSFAYYTETSLVLSAFFYAMCSTFFLGVFLIKYRVELLLFMPILIGLFCYYFYLSFQSDSSVQKPEKLYQEKGLMTYCVLICISFVTLMYIDIPWLHMFTSTILLEMGVG